MEQAVGETQQDNLRDELSAANNFSPDRFENIDTEVAGQSDGGEAASSHSSIQSPIGSNDLSPVEEGNLVNFVAEDFMEKIREGGVVSSASAFNLAPVDPRVLQNIDHLTLKLCENVAELTAQLSDQLKQICSVTAEHVRVYRSAIEKTSDNVDACIKTMYQLMAKTEEVHKQMYQIAGIHDQIKELKRMVTILEGYVDSL